MYYLSRSIGLIAASLASLYTAWSYGPGAGIWTFIALIIVLTAVVRQPKGSK